MRRVGLVVVAGLSACAGVEPLPAPAAAAVATAAPQLGELGVVPGEAMAFELRLAGILAGEAQLAVGALGDYEGHRAVVVRSRAATAGAAAIVRHSVDEATTVIDVATGRPLALDTLVEQGSQRTTASARFTDTGASITYRKDGEPAPRTLTIPFGAIPVHDAHTAMAHLRGWRPAPGTTRTVFLVGGRRLWRVDLTFAGEETIGSALGNRKAVRFTGTSFRANRQLAIETDKPTRRFSVWLSDDADRVPLRVTASTELGDVVIDLTEYTREPAARGE